MGGVAELTLLEPSPGVSCRQSGEDREGNEATETKVRVSPLPPASCVTSGTPLCASVSCFVNGAKFPKAPDACKHPVRGRCDCVSGRPRSGKRVPAGRKAKAVRLNEGWRTRCRAAGPCSLVLLPVVPNQTVGVNLIFASCKFI